MYKELSVTGLLLFLCFPLLVLGQPKDIKAVQNSIMIELIDDLNGVITERGINEHLENSFFISIHVDLPEAQSFDETRKIIRNWRQEYEEMKVSSAWEHIDGGSYESQMYFRWGNDERIASIAIGYCLPGEQGTCYGNEEKPRVNFLIMYDTF
ncbi:MAG: hypothetical protein WD317_07645 [Balneolaceae bacterium]